MIRTGRARAPRAMRGHRITRLVAAVMMLLALGASVLVSAGSPHHERTVPAAAAATSAPISGVQPAWHEHHHGNDWAPTLGKRLRPAATVAFLGVVPARAAEPEKAPGGAHVPAPSDSGETVTALGVLRV